MLSDKAYCTLFGHKVGVDAFMCATNTVCIPKEFVNDGYCSCPDCSDEPITSTSTSTSTSTTTTPAPASSTVVKTSKLNLIYILYVCVIIAIPHMTQMLDNNTFKTSTSEMFIENLPATTDEVPTDPYLLIPVDIIFPVGSRIIVTNTNSYCMHSSVVYIYCIGEILL